MSLEPEAFPKLAKLIARGADVTSGMAAMLDHCRSRERSAAWEQIAKLDFDSDLARLMRWLTGVLTDEPPLDNIDAFWFGLFNPADEAGNATSDMYLAGSTRFHTARADPGWKVRPEYWPRNRYAHSMILREIYRIAGHISGSEYVLCAAYAALAVAHLAGSVEPGILLGGRQERALAAGFDDGDDLLVGTITPQGFQPAQRQLW